MLTGESLYRIHQPPLPEGETGRSGMFSDRIDSGTCGRFLSYLRNPPPLARGVMPRVQLRGQWQECGDSLVAREVR